MNGRNTMLKGMTLRAADVWAGTVFLWLGLGLVVGGLRMPMGGTYAGVENPWYVSPGAPPLFLGVLFLLGAAGLILSGWREAGTGGMKLLGRKVGQGLRSSSARRSGLIWILLSTYAILLGTHVLGFPARWLESVGLARGWFSFLGEWEGVSYLLSTHLFLTAFLFLFHKPRRWWLSLFAFIVALVVAVLFSQILRVPLP
ncbi:MAG: hypothetical protein AAF514_02255 [Verrucomicrobiota bacterium]